jgi:integrase
MRPSLRAAMRAVRVLLPMASIKKRPNGRWRARYRDPSGKEHAKHFDRHVDAERFLTTVEHSKLIGGYVDPRAGRVTFGEYAEKWRAAQVWRPSSAAAAETNFRQHVLPRFGARPLASIRPSEVQAWVRELSDALAPATVKLAYRFFAAAMRAAVTDRVLAASPCVGVKLPALARERVVPLELHQVQALADAMPERYRALVIVGAGTGLRQGEAFGLTVDRVDFLRRSLTVDRQLVLLPEPHLAPPKTKASRRNVPLPDVVLDALSQHLAAFPSDGFVFTNERGETIRRSVFSRVWRRAVGASGIPTGTTFHDLRHHYASLLIRHGESVKVVQARLGHASAAETLDTYSHLWTDSEDRTRVAVDSVWRALADYLRTESER